MREGLSSYGVGIEELLLRAEKRALRAMSPTARCLIMALRFLSGRMSIEELRASVEGYGVPCASLEPALHVLERAGYAECSGGTCRLTEYGGELADALSGVVEGMRSLAYRVLGGEFGEEDVLAELVTATASAAGFVEAYVDDPRAGMMYFAVHVYVSGLSASVLAELARVNASVLDTVRRVIEEGGF